VLCDRFEASIEPGRATCARCLRWLAKHPPGVSP
jgi:hypothetical protein